MLLRRSVEVSMSTYPIVTEVLFTCNRMIGGQICQTGFPGSIRTFLWMSVVAKYAIE